MILTTRVVSGSIKTIPPLRRGGEPGKELIE
jgi:hypothetical protein